MRLKITAKTAIFDQHGRTQEAMPPCGTDMEARFLLEANKVWLRERRFGLEVRVQQVKWYPCASTTTSSSSSLSAHKRRRTGPPLQFLDYPAS